MCHTSRFEWKHSPTEQGGNCIPDTMSYTMVFLSFIKHIAVLKLVYVTDAVLKPALALSLPLSSHSRADTAITPAVFLLSLLMYSRASPVACLFICIPPRFGPVGFVLIDEISSHEKCVIYMRLACFLCASVCASCWQRWPLIELVVIQKV